MHIPCSPVAKLLVLISSLVAIALYLALVSAQFVASVLAGKEDWKSLRLAARLEPENAEYQYELGQFLRLAARLPEAEDAYSNAARLNPHNATYWLSLAAAQRVLGLSPGKQDPLQRAVVMNPKDAGVAWEAANTYLAQSELGPAFKEFKVALEASPSLSGSAISLCWNARPDADVLLRDALPPDRGVYSSFLEFLISKKESVSAEKVW